MNNKDEHEAGYTMADDTKIEIILVRMESKMDRISDRLGYFEDDNKAIKARLHDFGNALQRINAFNIDKHFVEQDKCNAHTEARLGLLEADAERRKGAMGLAKVLWAILGAVGVSGVAAVIRILDTGAI